MLFFPAKQRSHLLLFLYNKGDSFLINITKYRYQLLESMWNRLCHFFDAWETNATFYHLNVMSLHSQFIEETLNKRWNILPTSTWMLVNVCQLIQRRPMFNRRKTNSNLLRYFVSNKLRKLKIFTRCIIYLAFQ